MSSSASVPNCASSRKGSLQKMVRTRNEIARINCRGVGWSSTEEEACYDHFFLLCRTHVNIHDPAVFDDIFVELARLMTVTMRKEFSILKVKMKINMLRTHFRDYVRFTTLPGVRFNKFTNKFYIDPFYYEQIGTESNMHRYFRTNGFPRYHDCMEIFYTRGAAEIDFQGLPGYNRNNPLEFDFSSSDESDEENPTETDEECSGVDTD
ncbi:hypothetical protein DH2020_016708 [Rehmannia glutinosa]|uniref:Uncharacterized protein n=1 Tax=Rehmannia glutinosa TaxID=99300 RepID=A0ABR0WNS0_REHGL